MRPRACLHREDGCAIRLGESLKLGRLHGVAGRVAHDDDGTLGVSEQIRRLLDERRVALGPPILRYSRGR